VTSQQPDNSPSAEPESPDTEVIALPAPAPVFVDSTGRRSKLLRRLAYAFGVLVIFYGGLISVSLAGGPVRSSAVLPLPGLETDVNDSRAPARPSPPPSPSASSSKALFVNPLTRRTNRPPVSRIESTKVAPKPAPKPTPSKTPAPKATTSRPVESTTTPTSSASAPNGPTTAPTSKAPALPTVAPAPPGGGTTTGSGGSALEAAA
jgi:hypothetical protein